MSIDVVLYTVQRVTAKLTRFIDLVFYGSRDSNRVKMFLSSFAIFFKI